MSICPLPPIRRPDERKRLPLDAFAVSIERSHFAEGALIHEIGAISPHKPPAIKNLGASCSKYHHLPNKFRRYRAPSGWIMAPT